MHFDPDVLSNWHKIQLCIKYSSIFSIRASFNKLHDFDKGIYFPGNCYYENR